MNIPLLNLFLPDVFCDDLFRWTFAWTAQMVSVDKWPEGALQ